MFTEYINQLKEFAKDIKLNYSNIVMNHTGLTNEQFYGIILSILLTHKDSKLITAFLKEYETFLSETTIYEIKAAVSMMSMTNIYYRFTHIAKNSNYNKMPANLRMSIMRDSNINQLNFEIYCLAVSIINGCDTCINAHEEKLKSSAISEDTIQLIARICAIINSIATIC